MSRVAKTACGWELNDIAELGTVTSSANTTCTVVTGTPTPRSGGYCLKIATTALTVPNTYVRATYGVNETQIWQRIAFYHHALTSAALAPMFFRVLDDANTVQLSFTIDPSDTLIRAYRGNASGTLLGATSAGATADAWHYLDIHITISATVGVVEVWIDGIQRMNLTSQNTIASTGHTNILNYDYAFIHTTTNQASGSYIAFDDAAVNDTAGSLNNGRIGDGRVLWQAVTGAGSNTGQTIGGSAPAATNWQSVSELPPDSGVTFVYSASTGVRDTYAIADLPAGSTSVNAVEVIAQCQKSDAGAGSIGLTTKSGATTTEAAAQALSTNWAYYRTLLELDPATSAAWLVAAVNALEVGTTTE